MIIVRILEFYSYRCINILYLEFIESLKIDLDFRGDFSTFADLIHCKSIIKG